MTLTIVISARAATHSPTTRHASTAPAAASRPTTQVMDDWQSTSQTLRILLPPPRELTTSASRARLATMALPPLRKALALADEMSHSGPDLRPAALQHHYHLLAIMAFLGDRPAMVELDNARRSNNPEASPLARHAWYLTRWWPRLNRPADASNILDELQALAIASPGDDGLSSLLLQMREDLPADSPLAAQIETIISTHLHGPLAQNAISQLRFADKRRSLLGKPLLVKAPTLTGQPFSTRSLAGQTILLHFGLTTSAQWQEEHNALLQLADDLPNKFAIVTILCDEPNDDAQAYFAQHREVPWTVVRDPADPAGFAAQYGVDHYPLTIIISPKGNVLAVDVIPDATLIESLGGAPPSTRP